MIRSIDPFAHIESHSFVVSNLIRFINLFWYLGDENELKESIKKDNNQTFYGKIKRYSCFEVFIIFILEFSQ